MAIASLSQKSIGFGGSRPLMTMAFNDIGFKAQRGWGDNQMASLADKSPVSRGDWDKIGFAAERRAEREARAEAEYRANQAAKQAGPGPAADEAPADPLGVFDFDDESEDEDEAVRAAERGGETHPIFLYPLRKGVTWDDVRSAITDVETGRVASPEQMDKLDPYWWEDFVEPSAAVGGAEIRNSTFVRRLGGYARGQVNNAANLALATGKELGNFVSFAPRGLSWVTGKIGASGASDTLREVGETIDSVVDWGLAAANAGLSHVGVNADYVEPQTAAFNEQILAPLLATVITARPKGGPSRMVKLETRVPSRAPVVGKPTMRLAEARAARPTIVTDFHNPPPPVRVPKPELIQSAGPSARVPGVSKGSELAPRLEPLVSERRLAAMAKASANELPPGQEVITVTKKGVASTESQRAAARYLQAEEAARKAAQRPPVSAEAAEALQAKQVKSARAASRKQWKQLLDEEDRLVEQEVANYFDVENAAAEAARRGPVSAEAAERIQAEVDASRRVSPLEWADMERRNAGQQFIDAAVERQNAISMGPPRPSIWQRQYSVKPVGDTIKKGLSWVRHHPGKVAGAAVLADVAAGAVKVHRRGGEYAEDPKAWADAAAAASALVETSRNSPDGQLDERAFAEFNKAFARATEVPTWGQAFRRVGTGMLAPFLRTPGEQAAQYKEIVDRSMLNVGPTRQAAARQRAAAARQRAAEAARATEEAIERRTRRTIW